MEFKDVQLLAKKIIKIKRDPLMAEFQNMFDEMAVHTRKRKPIEKLLKARPNEPGEILDYRVENFESITYGSIIKAFDSLFRIFSSIGIKIQTGDEKTDKYLLTKNFMGNNFMMFFIKIYLKRMIEDANGWLIWLPGGEGSTDTSKIVEPYPELIFSFNLVDWDSEYIVFISDEKSLIQVGETYERTGCIYYIITKTEYYTYTELTGGKYELKLIYTHNFNELPVIPLGGDIDANGLYQSFFEPFVALANEAIRQFSDWQALSIMASFPIREEFQINCEIHEVKKKKVRKNSPAAEEGHNDISEYKVVNEIKALPRTMFGTIIRDGTSKDASMGSNVLDPNIPSVRFIAPGVEYVKNAFDTFQKLIEMAEDKLHLNLGDYALSGKAKELDLQSFEDMLNKIFLQLFDSMERSARYITAYRLMTTPEETKVKIIRPATFRIKTEVELMEELTKLKQSNAPAMLIAAVARELAMLRFSGDELNQKIFEIIASYDVLFTYSPSEKQSMFLANTALKEDVTNSNYMYTVLLNMAKQEGEASFIDKDPKLIYAKFLVEVKSHYTIDPILTDDSGVAV